LFKFSTWKIQRCGEKARAPHRKPLRTAGLITVGEIGTNSKKGVNSLIRNYEGAVSRMGGISLRIGRLPSPADWTAGLSTICQNRGKIDLGPMPALQIIKPRLA
jgi:hypothetical protein